MKNRLPMKRGKLIFLTIGFVAGFSVMLLISYTSTVYFRELILYMFHTKNEYKMNGVDETEGEIRVLLKRLKNNRYSVNDLDTILQFNPPYNYSYTPIKMDSNHVEFLLISNNSEYYLYWVKGDTINSYLNTDLGLK